MRNFVATLFGKQKSYIEENQLTQHEPDIAKNKELLNVKNINAQDLIAQIAKNEEKRKQTENALRKKNFIMEAMIKASGYYSFLKNADGIYKWCDRKFCMDFFGIKSSCETEIDGYTDYYLINQYIRSNKASPLAHTYIDIVGISDKHCICAGQRCRYIEIFSVDQKLFILDSQKSPLIINGKEYIAGFGSNVAHLKKEVYEKLNRKLKDGEAEILEKKKNASVYYLYEKVKGCGYEFTETMPALPLPDKKPLKEVIK